MCSLDYLVSTFFCATNVLAKCRLGALRSTLGRATSIPLGIKQERNARAQPPKHLHPQQKKPLHNNVCSGKAFQILVVNLLSLHHHHLHQMAGYLRIHHLHQMAGYLRIHHLHQMAGYLRIHRLQCSDHCLMTYYLHSVRY